MRPPCRCCRRRPAGSGREGRAGGGGLGPARRENRPARRGPGPAGVPILRESRAFWRKRCAPIPLVKRDALCNVPARVLSHRPPLSSPPTLLWLWELPGRLFLKKVVDRNLKWEFGVCFSLFECLPGAAPFPSSLLRKEKAMRKEGVFP